MNNIGTKKIETDRLLLRKFEQYDVANVFNNWAKDPENVKYLKWTAHENIKITREIVHNWINKYNRDTYYRWCIVLKSTNEAIGGIDVVHLYEDIECAEIGYVLSKKYWNQGIMTESLKAVQDYLFRKASCNRIQAIHSVYNPSSGRVMIKTGMKLEGILRNFAKTNTHDLCDAAIYSLLRSEFVIIKKIYFKFNYVYNIDVCKK